jgi:hypothetical protein
MGQSPAGRVVGCVAFVSRFCWKKFVSTLKNRLKWTFAEKKRVERNEVPEQIKGIHMIIESIHLRIPSRQALYVRFFQTV